MKVLLAIILGLIGLLMSSCGLLFLVLGGLRGIGTIAGPSLIIGVLLLWGAYTLVKSPAKEPPVTSSPPSEPK
jgi:hypothetical protein